MQKVTLPEATKENFVTPYLPESAKGDIKAARFEGKPCFIRVMPQTGDVHACKNCSGNGYVYVSYCEAGPFRYAPGSLATWFDGDGRNGKGWYKIAETVAYKCPECQAFKPREQ